MIATDIVSAVVPLVVRFGLDESALRKAVEGKTGEEGLLAALLETIKPGAVVVLGNDEAKSRWGKEGDGLRVAVVYHGELEAPETFDWVFQMRAWTRGIDGAPEDLLIGVFDDPEGMLIRKNVKSNGKGRSR